MTTRAWQRMLSGRRLDILDPSPLDVEIEDVAHGLARLARWNGQTSGRFVYSVAQHSCLVEAIVAELQPGAGADLRLAALLHDAPEYVLGDVITPVKAAIGPQFAEIERRLLRSIHLAFGLPPDLPPGATGWIKRADRIAAWHEATALAGFSAREADATFGRPERRISGLDSLLRSLPPAEAQEGFEHRIASCRAAGDGAGAAVVIGRRAGA